MARQPEEVWSRSPGLGSGRHGLDQFGIITLLIVIGGIIWKFRDHTANQREANLTDDIRE
jgi:hypothetical protein